MRISTRHWNQVSRPSILSELLLFVRLCGTTTIRTILPTLQPEPTPRFARGFVAGLHGAVQVRHRDPVGRVLEARHVQNQHRVGRRVKRRHGRKVTLARLPQSGSSKGDHQHAVVVVVVVVVAAQSRVVAAQDLLHVGSKIFQRVSFFFGG